METYIDGVYIHYCSRSGYSSIGVGMKQKRGDVQRSVAAPTVPVSARSNNSRPPTQTATTTEDINEAVPDGNEDLQYHRKEMSEFQAKMQLEVRPLMSCSSPE